MRLGVRVKMLIGFVAVALFTGALGVYTLYALGLLNAEQQAMYVDDLGGIYLVGKYVDVTWEGRTALLDYLISDDATERQSLRERIKASDAELPGIVDEMNAADTDVEAVQALALLTSDWNEYRAWRDERVLSAFDAGDHAAAMAAYRAEGAGLANAFASAAEALLDHKRAPAADVAASSQATHDVLRNMALSLSSAAITLGLLIGFLLSRKVARAARELASAASGLAHGSLDQRITFHSHDELGRMADAFRQMVAYQQEMAAAANAIAAGNLSQDVQPKAETDVLGIAFQRMTRSIRALLFEREQTENALIESDERRRLALEATQDVIYDCDLRLADSIVWSPSTRDMFGYEPGEMGATLEEWSEKIHPDDSARVTHEIATSMTHGGAYTSEYRHRRKDSTYVDVLTRGRVLLDEHGQPLRSIGAMMDITERKQAELSLAHRALHDALTELPNRTLIGDRLQQAIQATRQTGGSAALLLLDLDRFKDVNDTLGHDIGDQLLRQVGERLQAALPSSGTVARLGGDEFAVLLPQADVEEAMRVATVVLATLEQPFFLQEQAISVEASLGIALVPEHGDTSELVLRHADVVMYRAKRYGASPAVYIPGLDPHSPERLALLGELRQAIERDELLLHYQPKLDLRTGTLVGVEALVRWQHPQRGFLPPSEFIPLAEHTGLIHPLTGWVLEQALRQHQVWRSIGMEIPVAINLSRRVVQDPLLPGAVAQLLKRWDLPPSALVLEVTESSLMDDPLRAAENLTQLRDLGVCISIDDFGTGYSSLASLKNLPVDELKIDQSFVQSMASNAGSRAIVRAIIDLADALNLRVVAEGVEDRATWDVLASLGCDVAQGYFMSRPLTAVELEGWVAQIGPSWLAIAESSQVKDALQERIRGRGARLTAEEEFLGRKQAEAALRASEERNRLALQAAHTGTWDWDAIQDLLTWSPEMEVLSGLVPGSFEGTFAAFQGTIHPDDWPVFVMERQTALNERRDLISTYRTVWTDGTVHWIQGTGRGWYAADGTLARMTGTCTDITERKEAEEALRASEERFRKQYKSVPNPTYSWVQVGDDFVLQDFNDAAEAITDGRILEEVGSAASVWYADQPEILTDLHACMVERRTLRREMEYRYRTTRQKRQLVLSYVFVPPQTVMVHTEDVTEARQAEQQREAMAQSEKLRALGQMASGIAHDLNQSLMLVVSYADLARQGLVQDPPNLADVDDLLSTTSQAALDGGETVKRLLLFTRSAPEHDSQIVDLDNIIRDAAQLTAPRWRDAAQAEGRPISLHIETEGQPKIQGSPAQLRELMTNVIFNAVDALPTGGTIRLRVATEDGQGIIA